MSSNVPTTELEAVNVILTSIGETPLNTLSGTIPADATTAQSILNEISREVQAEGWHFNTEVEYPLEPDTSSNINVPDNTLRFSLDRDYHPSEDVTVRGTMLYNRQDRTYEFDDTIYCTLYLFFDFTDLPEAARRYITIRAARVFQDRMVGNKELHSFGQADEARARAALVDAEGDTSGYNMLDSYRRVGGWR